MPKSVLVRRVVVLGVVVLVATVASATAFADTFRLLEPVENNALSYSDARIAISFKMLSQQGIGYEGISFTITNKSSSAIAIDWNRSSMTLPDSQTSNVIHQGTKFISAGTTLPPTTIPPGGKLSDFVIPTLSIHYLNGWYTSPMNMKAGSRFGVYLALDNAGTSSGYNFLFEAVELRATLEKATHWLVLGGVAILVLVVLAILGY